MPKAEKELRKDLTSIQQDVKRRTTYPGVPTDVPSWEGSLDTRYRWASYSSPLFAFGFHSSLSNLSPQFAFGFFASLSLLSPLFAFGFYKNISSSSPNFAFGFYKSVAIQVDYP